jgi:hypothetical protein
MSLTKEIKDLFNENTKALKKNIEDTRRQKNPLMFMNKQNKCCGNGYTTESNLQIQCNSHQNPNVILHRNRKTIISYRNIKDPE